MRADDPRRCGQRATLRIAPGATKDRASRGAEQARSSALAPAMQSLEADATALLQHHSWINPCVLSHILFRGRPSDAGCNPTARAGCNHRPPGSLPAPGTIKPSRSARVQFSGRRRDIDVGKRRNMLPAIVSNNMSRGSRFVTPSGRSSDCFRGGPSNNACDGCMRKYADVRPHTCRDVSRRHAWT